MANGEPKKRLKILMSKELAQIFTDETIIVGELLRFEAMRAARETEQFILQGRKPHGRKKAKD